MQAYEPQANDRLVDPSKDIDDDSMGLENTVEKPTHNQRPSYFIGTDEIGLCSRSGGCGEDEGLAGLIEPFSLMDASGGDCGLDGGGVSELLSPLAYRVDSAELTFHKKRLKPKFIPKPNGEPGDRYILGDILGEGCYSKVKEVMDMRTLRRMAVKIMTHKRLRKIPNGEENAQREMSFLRELNRHRHENVIHMHDLIVNEAKHKFYVILEYCAVVLQELIDNSPHKRLPIFQAHGYYVQLINGLEHLHSLGIIHKDIKPGNLLINNSNVIKICDFGVAELIDRFRQDDLCSVSQGTPAFQPPEIADGAARFSGSRVDIWSTGVTLYNLVSGSYPFDGDTVFRLFERISQCQYHIPAVIQDQDELVDLIRKMLSQDPTRRITIKEIRRHPWFTRRHPILNEKLVWVDQLPLLSGQSVPGRSTTVEPYLEIYYNGEPVVDEADGFECEEGLDGQLEIVDHVEHGQMIFNRELSNQQVDDDLCTVPSHGRTSTSVQNTQPVSHMQGRSVSGILPSSGNSQINNNQESGTSRKLSTQSSVAVGGPSGRKRSFFHLPPKRSKSIFLGCIGVGTSGRRKRTPSTCFTQIS